MDDGWEGKEEKKEKGELDGNGDERGTRNKIKREKKKRRKKKKERARTVWPTSVCLSVCSVCSPWACLRSPTRMTRPAMTAPCCPFPLIVVPSHVHQPSVHLFLDWAPLSVQVLFLFFLSLLLGAPRPVLEKCSATRENYNCLCAKAPTQSTGGREGGHMCTFRSVAGNDSTGREGDTILLLP